MSDHTSVALDACSEARYSQDPDFDSSGSVWDDLARADTANTA